MKHIRRWLSLALVMLILPGMTGMALAKDAQAADYRYVIENGECTITEHIGIEEKVRVPETIEGCPVTGIGPEAFYDCSAASIYLPDSVRTIGERAFSYCDSLKSIRFPDGPVDVGPCPIVDCYSLEQIIISPFHPRLMLADGALYDREEKRLVFWPACRAEKICAVQQGTEEIGKFAFDACREMERVILPGSLRRIRQKAFEYCDLLNEVTIPEGVTDLEYDAFYTCEGLKRVSLPASLSNVNGNPFSTCLALEKLDLAEDNRYLRMDNGALYSIADERLICVPARCQEVSLSVAPGTKAISDGAMGECMNLTEVTLPDGLESIGEFAFWDCKSLNGIVIPDSVKSIGQYAFCICESLSDIAIPEGVERIGRGVFNECVGLKHVSLPASLMDLGDCPFDGCHALESVDLADGNPRMRIVDGLLYDTEENRLISLTNLSAVKSYDIAEGTVAIGEGAFCMCDNLTGITMPDSVLSIGNGAFMNCCGLTEVVLSNGVTELPTDLFCGCSNLKHVVLPEHLTTIGDAAFYDCGKLERIIIPASVTFIDSMAFWDCDNVTLVVRSGSYAESYCKSEGIRYETDDALVPDDDADPSTSVTCPGCGHVFRRDEVASFCPDCGAALCVICPGCGHTLWPREGMRFCPDCGTSLEATGTNARPTTGPVADDGVVDEDSPAEEVRRVQQKLIALGLLPSGAVDGKYGETTAVAVRRFQERVNELAGHDVLEVTGRMDPQSLEYLDSYAEEWANMRKATAEPTAAPEATAKPTAAPTAEPLEPVKEDEPEDTGEVNQEISIDENSHTESIRYVQEMLSAIGLLDSDDVNGEYDSATTEAVRRFQSWVNRARGEDILPVTGKVNDLTRQYLEYAYDHEMTVE